MSNVGHSEVKPRVDFKAWARRIVELHKAGGKVNKTALEMAHKALRMEAGRAV